MKKLLHWFFPEKFFENPAYARAFALGMLYTVFLILQLFTYENFREVTLGFGFPGGEVAAAVLAIVLPLVELLALPFLLSMTVTPAIVVVSRTCVVGTPLLWGVIALWQNLSSSASKLNVGIFGDTLSVPVGWWFILFSGLLVWAAVLVVREKPTN